MGEEMQDLSSWAEHLNDPLVLAGFVFMLFAGIIHTLLKMRVLRLSKSFSEQLIKKSLLYVFILSIIVVLLGFVVAFKKDGRHNGTEETFIQKTEGEKSPAVMTEGKDSSVNITYGAPSKEAKEEWTTIKGTDKVKDDVASQSSHHIEQKTESNQSPAVVSGGDVNLTFENK